MSQYFVGIDPGLSGAVAVLQVSDGNRACMVLVVDTPTETVKKGRKKRRQFIAKAMSEIVVGLPKSTIVVLERVSAMPQQGVSSMFLMGRGLGIWEGIVGTLGYRLEWVEPQRWKKTMIGVRTGKDKEASIRRAIALRPEWADQLVRKKDHGRAEAILIAEYGWRTFK